MGSHGTASRSIRNARPFTRRSKPDKQKDKDDDDIDEDDKGKDKKEKAKSKDADKDDAYLIKTDKDGNIISKETVGKSPDSASSTDNNSGITTTSVLNPDGTRTVITTDKDGNVITTEIVFQRDSMAYLLYLAFTILPAVATQKAVGSLGLD